MLGACLACACATFAVGLKQQSKPETEAPQLKLRVIPEKTTYRLGEGVFVKTEFTNVSGKTLCFPQPATEFEATYPGYVTTFGDLPAESDSDEMSDHYDSGPPWPEAKLLPEIRSRWTKLEPDAVYVTDSSKPRTSFRVAGSWRLMSTYHPPESAFNTADSRRYLARAAESLGCTIPRKVSSEPAYVEIADENTK